MPKPSGREVCKALNTPLNRRAKIHNLKSTYGAVMTRFERLLTLSATTCCVCDHHLSVQELDEFYGATDEHLHDQVHCRACLAEQLVLCRECSACYTADGICGECAAREYATAS
jgi:hypothetical protein